MKRSISKLTKVALISLSVWIFLVLLFLVESYFFGKGKNLGDLYSMPQNITFITTIILGSVSFIALLVSTFLIMYKKIRAWAVVIVLVVIIIFGGGTIFTLYKIYSKPQVPTWTGNELFEAVNEHRKSIGVPEVILGEGLCDNLVSRWQTVKDGKGHEGSEEWAKNEGIQTNYGYGQMAELYIITDTPQHAIEFWSTSPGHEFELDNSKWTDGCTYANEGIGVLVLSTKVR